MKNCSESEEMLNWNKNNHETARSWKIAWFEELLKVRALLEVLKKERSMGGKIQRRKEINMLAASFLFYYAFFFLSWEVTVFAAGQKYHIPWCLGRFSVTKLDQALTWITYHAAVENKNTLWICEQRHQ